MVVPHTAGRYQVKKFRKVQCPIVERLVDLLTVVNFISKLLYLFNRTLGIWLDLSLSRRLWTLINKSSLKKPLIVFDLLGSLIWIFDLFKSSKCFGVQALLEIAVSFFKKECFTVIWIQLTAVYFFIIGYRRLIIFSLEEIMTNIGVDLIFIKLKMVTEIYIFIIYNYKNIKIMFIIYL